MTRDKDFKRLVRARASRSGERFTTARAALLRQRKETGMVRVTCEVTTGSLTEEQVQKWRERQQAELEKLSETHPGVQVERPSAGEELPLLLLKEIGGNRELPIWCGSFEASAIALAQEGIETQRPMTHDLLRDVVEALGSAREVRITELQDATYLAELAVTDTAGAERTVSCRPSDGIALAVRANIAISVAEHLFVAGDSQ